MSMMKIEELKSKEDFIKFYQEQGLNVIPCRPKSKKPSIKWKSYQSKKYEGIFPKSCELAVICGKISENLVVIDLDAPELFEEFKGLLDKTLIDETGSGGYHIWCRVFGEIPNTMKLINDKGQRIDIQSEGACVMVPPSIHEDTGEPYKIISSTLKINFVHFEAILSKLSRLGFETSDPHGKKIDEIIKGVNQGERNAMAFKYACYLLQQKHFDFDTSMYELKKWNEQNNPPLPDKELDIILKSAAKYPIPTERKSTKQKVGRKRKSTGNVDDDEKSHTDYANDIMAAYRFKTLRDTEEILYYDNGVYKNGAETLIREEAEKRIIECSSYMATEILKTIQRTTYVERSEFDKDKNILNVRNCLINIRTGEVDDHTPDYLSRVQLTAKHDPKAVAFKFCRFIRQCLPNPVDAVTVIEEFASCLIRDIDLQKLYMFVGGGSNGKSTFLDVVEFFLGDDNVSNVAIGDLIYGRFSRAELDGKMANIYADITDDELGKLGVLRALISGDPVLVEKKNQQPFKMRSYAKMLFSANALPEINEDSDAVFRRFIITEWNQKFDGLISKSKLVRSLTTDDELSGILNILIRVGLDLEKRGMFKYAQSTEQLRYEWKGKADPVNNFINTCIELVPDGVEIKDVIYHKYVEFCLERKIIPKDVRGFNGKIKRISTLQDAVVRIKNKSTRVWQGCKLKTGEKKPSYPTQKKGLDLFPAKDEKESVREDVED